ncbi:DUF7545 family protein [Halanaeroarchaeum sulfurireducens]|uniref:Uncharacterized protein n=1 Tax=Halanaeroarchaeum sulfurireducens TaxID=1604004 RepID=A0A0F7PBR7_9EURY|nr:hypothetical protein [Halanaeroarchaeum sulfurireducens]AKH98132.1 hypothetical protein HLASF_1656 [Halanaeroarchaeum sulfurireducens]ALG82526.1 hypothetical protein HLASA_1643 [Halanaeroarchaeum sulfurireducens]
MELDRQTISLDVDGETDELELPADLLDLFRETPEETDAEIVADMVVMAFAERAHAIVHHGENADDEELQAIESEAMDVFEDRFGTTYAEMTGHSH